MRLSNRERQHVAAFHRRLAFLEEKIAAWDPGRNEKHTKPHFYLAEVEAIKWVFKLIEEVE